MSYYRHGDLPSIFGQVAQISTDIGPVGPHNWWDAPLTWATENMGPAMLAGATAVVGGGVISELIPPAVSGFVDQVQPYVSPFFGGTTLPGATTNADPNPVPGTLHNTVINGMNPPDAGIQYDGYSTAAYHRRMRRGRRRRRGMLAVSQQPPMTYPAPEAFGGAFSMLGV